MKNRTIAAISTPSGQGGIGIVRISGPDALDYVLPIFRRGRISSDLFLTYNPALFKNQIQTHRLYYGHVVDPSSKKCIDEVFFVYMKAPNSFTKEDVIEIHSHSGYAILNRILDLIFQRGAFQAEPGEFTKLAFLNGRIDLTQAEAIMDAINANSQRSLELAHFALNGHLAEIINSIRSTLFSLLVKFETNIDFIEEIDDFNDLKITSKKIIAEAVHRIKNLLSISTANHPYKIGFKVSILGPPNVGKSSLLNYFAKNEKAIVSEIAGTTRDIIESHILINGTPFNFYDTAGLCDSQNTIEKIGIEKALSLTESTDFFLFVFDFLTFDSFIKTKYLSNMPIDSGNTLFILNKSDITPTNFQFKFPHHLNHFKVIDCSVKFQLNMDSISDFLIERTLLNSKPDLMYNLNDRQSRLLKSSLESIQDTLRALENNLPIDIAAIDLQASIDSLDDILGQSFNNDVLDAIFSQFCIGK